jgi:hypothetical protein
MDRRRFLELGAAAGAGLVLRPARLLAADVPAPELIIVSPVGEISAAAARRLLRRAGGGATVLVESGAVFGDDAALRVHRESLAHLGVDVGAPRALWPRPRGGIPYVEYRWPVAAMVRDHSRVIPVLPRSGDEVIARVDGIAAALRRRVGRGCLVVLGSPLGPALDAGDTAAGAWLAALAGRAYRPAP